MLAEIALGSLLGTGNPTPTYKVPNVPNNTPIIRQIKTHDDSSNTDSQSGDVYSGMDPNEANIVFAESRGQANATNGKYYGLYQLDPAYLNGDYSIAGQKKAAQKYMQDRYGSWADAWNFHQANNWW